MTTHAATGASQIEHSYNAGFAAAEQACSQLAPHSPTCLIAFTTDTYDQAAVVQGIRAASKQAPLIGCCAGGIISNAGTYTNGVVVLALTSDALKLDLGLVAGVKADPSKVADQLADQLEDALDQAAGSQAALVLVDGLAGTLTDFVQHATAAFGPLCPMVGGGAGDSFQFKQTYQFVNDQVISDGAAVGVLQSPTPMGIGVQHGWEPAARGLVVTRSEGTIIYELDGRPAFAVYQELFPDLTVENFGRFVIDHPIGLPQINGEFLIRDPLRTHPDGSIECIASVPKNVVAHIMHGSPETLFNAAQLATKRALAAIEGPPAALIIFDCVSRLAMLGDEAATEVQRIREVAGLDVPVVGMFSFGEIAAAETGGALFHNKTVVVYAIGQA
ncbi:FIST signal transduction protein [Herpetosiphon giganteus]|uniref:FIST signal transduction protein n=1 Tax=Herpetosiphon giganteus TaxID=2029754 RepID=UPI0019568ED3|nr:FIST N-terminal domain-containing protein [Herpetosiphon giganteus]MBM7842582.1 hypothetical protein [Herpetosiphon giganteus]